MTDDDEHRRLTAERVGYLRGERNHALVLLAEAMPAMLVDRRWSSEARAVLSLASDDNERGEDELATSAGADHVRRLELAETLLDLVRGIDVDPDPDPAGMRSYDVPRLRAVLTDDRSRSMLFDLCDVEPRELQGPEGTSGPPGWQIGDVWKDDDTLGDLCGVLVAEWESRGLDR